MDSGPQSRIRGDESVIAYHQMGAFKSLNEQLVTVQHHSIEIFSAGCPLCKHVTDVIEIGMCKGCSQGVYNVNDMTEEIKAKMKTYDVTSVPTVIIDGNIKVVGTPDFPWICGEELYSKLKRDYSMTRTN